jgi:hypothetical protein
MKVALLAGLLSGLIVAAVARGDDGPRVVVRDTHGDVVATAALPAGGRFAIAYCHSVYGAPAEERFQARDDGFALVAIASPSRRVLEYYELDAPMRRERGRLVLTPAPAHYDTLALAATERGRRTLVVGEQRLPLYGQAVHLRLTVEGT